MSDTDWISARGVIERLAESSDHPEAAVLRCVRDHDCRSRAKVLLLDGQAVASRALLYDSADNDRGLRYLRPRFWENIAKDGIQDWKLGCFSYTEEAPPEHFGHGVQLNRQAAGVEFFWPDIQNILQLPKGKPLPQAMVIATLPEGASDNDRKHASLAHEVAKLISLSGIKKPKAIARVVDEAPDNFKTMRKVSSIERVVRAAYDLMYDDRGKPRQK